MIRPLPVALFLLAVLLFPIPASAQGGDKMVEASCREFRRTVAGAIEIYYIEYPETYGMITIDMLLRSGALSKMPHCQGGGEYSIDANGEVYCSLHQPNPSLMPVTPPPAPGGEPATGAPEGEPGGDPTQLTDANPFVRPDEIPGPEAEEPPEIAATAPPDAPEHDPEPEPEPVLPAPPAGERLVTAQDLGTFVRFGKDPGRAAGPGQAGGFDELFDTPAARTGRAAPPAPAAARPLSAREHNALGMKLADAGTFDDALVHFQKALDLAPDSKIYLYNLCLTFARVGKFEQAKYHIDRARRLDPGNARIESLRAMVDRRLAGAN